MNHASKDIRDLLEENSELALVKGDNLFIAQPPLNKNKSVTLYDIAGGVPDLSLSGETYYRDAVQIIVRDPSYDEAMTIAFSIMRYLQGQCNITINATYYTLIYVIMAPTFLDIDTNKVYSVLCSIETQRRPIV